MTTKFEIERIRWDDNEIFIDIRYNPRLCFQLGYVRSKLKSETLTTFNDYLYAMNEVYQGTFHDEAVTTDKLLGPFLDLMAVLAENDRESVPAAVLSDYLYAKRIQLEASTCPQGTSFEAISLGTVARELPGQLLSASDVLHLRSMPHFTSNSIKLVDQGGLQSTKVVAMDVLCYFKSCSDRLQRVEADRPWIYEQIAVAIQEKKLNSNICRPFGVVIDTNDNTSRMMGVLLVYIENKGTLKDVALRCTDEGMLNQWANELETIVKNMHKAGLIWGDAKPDNVLVDNEGKLWVIDVDGGHTPTWVDEEKKNTKEGDLQGLDNIRRWLTRRRTSP